MCMSVCKFNVTIREIERVYVCVCERERESTREPVLAHVLKRPLECAH